MSLTAEQRDRLERLLTSIISLAEEAKGADGQALVNILEDIADDLDDAIRVAAEAVEAL